MQPNWLFTVNPLVFSKIFKLDDGCNMRFLGMLDLCLWTFTANWLCFLRTCWTCALECLCKCHKSQRKKWAERWGSSGEAQVWLSFMKVMRGELFLCPVCKHTGWDLWQCTLNSAISFPMDTCQLNTPLCWAVHVSSCSIRNSSSAEWGYCEPGCLIPVGHSNFVLHLNRH